MAGTGALRDGPVAVLANPTAGRGRHRGLLPALVDRLGTAGRVVRVLDAGTSDEAEAACLAAVADGAAALVALGGDGTVHRALQAVAGTGVAFGAVPVGTGNDFATGVGLPAAPAAAVDMLVAAVRAGRTRPVDLALLTGAHGLRRWFGGVLGAGFDAVVNERANGMRWPHGNRRYDVAIVLELARLRPRDYALRLDGVAHRLPAVLVAVGNVACYGGGMRVCPAADPTDGRLDVVVVAPISRTTFIRLKPRVYRGTHVEHPAVRQFRASTVEISADGIVGYADGERIGPLPVSVVCAPGALHVLTS